jgi:hypothetical protein
VSDAQAEKPEATPGESEAPNPAASAGDSGNNEQKWQEALKWKEKAENYNALERQLRDRDARLAQLEQLAYGGGRQATDPYAEALAQAVEAAKYDPVAQVAVSAERRAVTAEAERWLSDEILRHEVPKAKQEQVKYLVRNAGFQMGVEQALSLVTDPDSRNLAQQLAATQAELERMKGAKPNGTSPAFAAPSTASADDGKVLERIPRADYLATLNKAQQRDASDEEKERAKALMRAVASNKTRLEG